MEEGRRCPGGETWFCGFLRGRVVPSRVGFTLIEALVAFFIGTFLLLAIGRGMGVLTWQFRQGSGDLQNLQSARLALASLRRDFSRAVPFLSASDQAAFREVSRRFPISFGPRGAGTGNSSPIRLLLDGIEFFAFGMDCPKDQMVPPLELIRYSFDPKTRTLVRSTPKGRTEFHGILNARFKAYAHEASPEVPLLWVSFEVLEDQDNGQAPQPLAMAATLGSRFIAADRRNPHWNLSSLQP